MNNNNAIVKIHKNIKLLNLLCFIFRAVFYANLKRERQKEKII